MANNDTASTNQGVPVTINVLANNYSPRGYTLTVTALTGFNGGPAYGKAVINADNTITYTPPAGFSGTDTFSYLISDGQGGTAEATVTVTVSA